MSTDINKYRSVPKDTNLYSDFTVNFTAHPDNKELVRVVNETAIMRSIRNLVLTNKYERRYQPDIKSNIRNLLFEIVTPQNAALLKSYIEETITNHEKRANLVNVEVVPNEDFNQYLVNIVFYTINNQSPLSFTISLDRIR